MTVAQANQRASFQMAETEIDSNDLPPISRLALVGMILGILSLIAVLSPPLLPLAVLAVCANAIAVVRLIIDKSKGGIRLGQIGLGLSVLATSIVVTALISRDSYLYSHAETHAKTFLNLLSSGKMYEAFELTRPEYDRQIAGTDLAQYYQQVENMTPPPPNGEQTGNMPSAQSMQDTQTRERLVEFKSAATTAAIMAAGKNANWTLVRGNGIAGPSDAFRVNVVMTDASNPTKNVNLLLFRNLRKSKVNQEIFASWHIDIISFAP